MWIPQVLKIKEKIKSRQGVIEACKQIKVKVYQAKNNQGLKSIKNHQL